MKDVHPSQALVPTFEAYQLARLSFFHDYIYVLRMTGPGSYRLVEQIEMPNGFHQRPQAVKLLEIGQRWQYLHKYVSRSMCVAES